MDLGQARRGALQVELDHLGRAGPDEEQHLDVGAALQQAVHHTVEFVVDFGKAGQIALVDDCGGESGLGEDHHAGGGLDEMSAGARPDDEEEGVLDLAVQPHDAGEAAEHLALATLAQHRNVIAAGRGGRAEWKVHDAAPACCSLAARSFKRNCVALVT